MTNNPNLPESLATADAWYESRRANLKGIVTLRSGFNCLFCGKKHCQIMVKGGEVYELFKYFNYEYPTDSVIEIDMTTQTMSMLRNDILLADYDWGSNKLIRYFDNTQPESYNWQDIIDAISYLVTDAGSSNMKRHCIFFKNYELPSLQD